MSLLSFIKRLPIVWLWLVLVFLASGLIINLFQLLLLPLWFIKKDLFRWANLNVVYLHWCRKYMITRIDLLVSDNRRFRSARDNDQRPKHFCSNAVLCPSFM